MNDNGVVINGIALQVLIQERGLTVQEVSKKANLDSQTLYNWIRGKHKAREDKYYQLCRALSVAPEILQLSSTEIVELGRTTRVLRWHMKEITGTNDDPSYSEIRDVTTDLQSESERESEEDEVREEKITVYSEAESHSDSESNAEEGDGEQGS